MKTNRAALGASVLLLIFIGVCVWLVFQYVASEEKRDLQNWQERLGLMAEAQKRSVERWLSKQTEALQTLADNPLVQLYVSELSRFDAGGMNEAQLGQLHHLKNLINASARSAGVFTPLKTISSNSAQTVNDGLALYNHDGMLLSTRYFPAQDAFVEAFAQRALAQKKRRISKIYSNPAGQPRFVIAVPVSSVQSVGGGEYPGIVVAVVNPQTSLYKMITRHWYTTSSDESLLAIDDGNVVSYISPLAEPFGLFHQQSATNTALASVYAVKNPGSFALKNDYKNTRVLVTSRKINPTNWVLVQKINASEALQESISHRKFILIILLLAVFFVAVSFIAIWRHATSVHLQKITDKLSARTALLNAVGDSIKDSIFLLDNKQKLVLVNRALADFLGVDADDVRGKALNHLYDVDTAKQLLAIKCDDGDVRNRELRLEINGRRYDYHVSIVTLKHEKYQHSHLYVLHDITDLKDAQGRHNRMMDAIIQTLVRLTDIHDPHCANHSERTREVAVAIARAMDLPQPRLNALAMAAQLANIGKLYVPADILTRTGPLSEEESAILRKNNQYSVDILQELKFDGPVIDFVKQKNEYLDGSGYPLGIAGEEILLESRILAVANAFVAMSSARAYRPGKPLKDVLDTLFEQADVRYDRQVIAALLYVAENRADWRNWQNIE